MLYITFIMRDGQKITVSKEEADRILRHPGNLVRVKEEGKWNGYSINKNFIVSTTPDIGLSPQSSLFDPPKIEKEKDTRIEVPGSWQKIDVREKIIKFWNFLKEKGHFREFNSYEEWEKAKYPTKIV